jgi:hypothetical protein
LVSVLKCESHDAVKFEENCAFPGIMHTRKIDTLGLVLVIGINHRFLNVHMSDWNMNIANDLDPNHHSKFYLAHGIVVVRAVHAQNTTFKLVQFRRQIGYCRHGKWEYVFISIL